MIDEGFATSHLAFINCILLGVSIVFFKIYLLLACSLGKDSSMKVASRRRSDGILHAWKRVLKVGKCHIAMKRLPMGLYLLVVSVRLMNWEEL